MRSNAVTGSLPNSCQPRISNNSTRSPSLPVITYRASAAPPLRGLPFAFIVQRRKNCRMRGRVLLQHKINRPPPCPHFLRKPRRPVFLGKQHRRVGRARLLVKQTVAAPELHHTVQKSSSIRPHAAAMNAGPCRRFGAKPAACQIAGNTDPVRLGFLF